MSFDSSTPIYTGTVTTDEYGRPTLTPQPKVLAATGGSAAGTAAGVLLIWLIESFAGIDIPTLQEGAILLLVTTAVTFVAGWVKRPSIKAN